MMTGDVLLLAKYVSTDAVGQYAMISRLYVLGIALLTAMLYTFLPEIVNVTHDAGKLSGHFRTYVKANLGLGIIGWACFYFLGAPLCQLIAHRSLSSVQAGRTGFCIRLPALGGSQPFL